MVGSMIISWLMVDALIGLMIIKWFRRKRRQRHHQVSVVWPLGSLWVPRVGSTILWWQASWQHEDWSCYWHKPPWEPWHNWVWARVWARGRPPYGMFPGVANHILPLVHFAPALVTRLGRLLPRLAWRSYQVRKLPWGFCDKRCLGAPSWPTSFLRCIFAPATPRIFGQP